jgi:hypothetical protein
MSFGLCQLSVPRCLLRPTTPGTGTLDLRKDKPEAPGQSDYRPRTTDNGQGTRDKGLVFYGHLI